MRIDNLGSDIGITANAASTYDRLSAVEVQPSAAIEGDYGYTVLNDSTIEITKYNSTGENVVIPDKIGDKAVTSIGKNAFQNCTSIVSLTIPNSVTIIKDMSFSSCTSLEKITFSESLTSIGMSAFASCANLNGVTIPASVESIGIGAFAGCTKLSDITIPESVTSIGYAALYGTMWDENYVGDLVIVNNILIEYKGSDSAVTIPNGVEKIAELVFSGNADLKKVTLPDSLKEIEDSAFSGCTGLSSITFPDSVTTIGNSAFLNAPV